MDHNQILGIVKAGDTFSENGVQAAGKGAGYLFCRGRITVGAKGRQFLDDSKVLDIPGNGCLCAVEAGSLELLKQLFLGQVLS